MRKTVQVAVVAGALALGVVTDAQQMQPAGMTPAPTEMSQSAAVPPALHDKARDFKLKRLDGELIQLSALFKQGPVVMLMLRGWVGYQCPICNRQVGDF